MKSVQQEVDERSNLTGTNKFELLLFRLGGDENGQHSELFGINVFNFADEQVLCQVKPVSKSLGSRLGRAF
jgi:two-component system chemotaxis response regulator CheV